MLKLDIANNGKRDGWICIDIESNANIQLDISKQKLPFEDGEIQAIYSSHTIEHIFPDQLWFVLSEFYRVLCDNGNLRIVTPDFTIALNSYLNNDINFLNKHAIPVSGHPNTMFCKMMSWSFSHFLDKNNIRKFGHVMAFDKETINFYLNKIGFRNIEIMKFGKHSNIFENCDNPGHSETSLYMEAKK